MELYYSCPNLLDGRKNLIALGTFDGVHIGHQKLIRSMVSESRKTGARSVVVSFNNHPRQFLRPQDAPFILTPSPTKAFLISRLGVESLVLLPFDNRLALMEPLEFIREVIVECFEPSKIFVGYNFTFGHKGAGTPGLLEEMGKRFGFGINTLSPVCQDGVPVSSTLVRKTLSQGDILGARKFLGHWPLYMGKVVPGDGLGKTLGFPTANLSVPGDLLIPPPGVYYGKALVDSSPYDALANIGFRPTVSSSGKLRFEVHIPDFRGELYGRELKFFLKKHIREEKMFSSLEELKQQIRRDIASIKDMGKSD